mmetsp:Transcript_67063/g.188903  ORF Transcript_67063/g.188903 Transcript_67063/m.188903 type:complete len:101 (-) Transcript_67063:63-365(-)
MKNKPRGRNNTLSFFFEVALGKALHADLEGRNVEGYKCDWFVCPRSVMRTYAVAGDISEEQHELRKNKKDPTLPELRSLPEVFLDAARAVQEALAPEEKK